MSKNNENIEKLELALSKLQSNENIIYFLVYDTRNNARASVKHIYDMALTLKESGFQAKLLAEDKTYGGVSGWLGDKYDSLEVVTIKDDRIEIKIEDIPLIHHWPMDGGAFVTLPQVYTEDIDHPGIMKSNLGIGYQKCGLILI